MVANCFCCFCCVWINTGSVVEQSMFTISKEVIQLYEIRPISFFCDLVDSGILECMAKIYTENLSYPVVRGSIDNNSNQY